MSIDDLIKHAGEGDFSKANDVFNELINTKMQDAIDQEKISVANTIFNGAEEEDAELEDVEIEDEDLEGIEDIE